MLRTTSVYTVKLNNVPHARDFMLSAWRIAVKAADATVTESFVTDEGIPVLRFRIKGGDVAALALFHTLVGTAPATLHTGVGVNRRPVN